MRGMPVMQTLTLGIMQGVEKSLLQFLQLGYSGAHSKSQF